MISPLLANIYLNYLDTVWENKFTELGTLVRYADDLVILCKTKEQALKSIDHEEDEREGKGKGKDRANPV